MHNKRLSCFIKESYITDSEIPQIADILKKLNFDEVEGYWVDVLEGLGIWDIVDMKDVYDANEIGYNRIDTRGLGEYVADILDDLKFDLIDILKREYSDMKGIGYFFDGVEMLEDYFKKYEGTSVYPYAKDFASKFKEVESREILKYGFYKLSNVKFHIAPKAIEIDRFFDGLGYEILKLERKAYIEALKNRHLLNFYADDIRGYDFSDIAEQEHKDWVYTQKMNYDEDGF